MAATALVETAAPKAGAMVSDPPVVRLEQLAKHYGKRSAVRGISLTLQRGELYGLIGPDGAGKSSVMKMLAGVLRPDEGHLEVFGTRIDSELACERAKERLGFMPQGLGLNLYPDLTVDENIDYFARLRLVASADAARRRKSLLAMTRLESFRDRPMKNLSGGMKQKLALVCTLIHEPELLILDEPTTGVDPLSRRDFWNILGRLLRERSITALVSTAYLDEASRFDRLALMYGGDVLAAGTPAELRALAHEPEVHPGEPELEGTFISLLKQRRSTPVPDTPFSAPTARAAANRDGIAIEARELTRDFGKFRAVDRLSFDVRRGEIFGLLGANGAGKTTVIKMLTGILLPSAGSGHVAGADMRRAQRDVRRQIGYVSQAFSLYSDLTVAENLMLSAGIYGLAPDRARERIAATVSVAGLDGNERSLASALPMGIRQRLALACALVHEPKVLFLDEPTSGVDPIGRRRFWEILGHLAREEGVAILITTHYMTEAERCDRLGLMHDGRLIDVASPAALKEDMARRVGELLELDVDAPDRALEVLRAEGYSSAALHGRLIHLHSRDAASARKHVASLCEERGVRVHSIAKREISLEDVFIYRVAALEGGAS